MKITFSKTHTYVPEWRDNNQLPKDEQVRAVLRIMNVSDLLFLLDHFSEAGLEGSVEVADVEVKQIKQILEACGHLLPEYVALENFFDQEDDLITIQDVVEFPFFLNLSAELLMKLAEQSSPNDEDEGNLNAPSVSEVAQ